ncbi:MAG TPA: DNA mismatch repair endonuclease MutL [Fimbriimonadaceae bacterium]|nr:DNA mismatch repair endonuclease MutL [Fimbriimonadaceae bacterium]
MQTTQSKIRLLDPHTINQIAAGEVVERPSSAVKELVENALDAGAARIAVRLEQSGRRLIEVADDGCGMDADSARLALQRHATSKITSVGDLQQVKTLGFRGEALPSIASVSRLTLSTAEQDGLRTVLYAEDGLIEEPTAESGPRGTTVKVEDLFHNTPARLKFLKTDATELANAVDVVSKCAVSRPDVAFRLVHGETTVVETSGSGDPLTALAEVWGRDAVRALAPVDAFNGTARVVGYVSPPHFTKPNRNWYWLFVNGRPVRSKTLTAALDQAFRSLTPERRYPLAHLEVMIDPAKVDVNVSPTKSDVKFHQDGAVFDAVRRAVTDALLKHGMVPDAESVGRATDALRASGGNLREAAVQLAMLAQPRVGQATEPTLEIESRAMPDLLKGLRVLGQVADTFIVAENDTALLIIDQHVAHERVLYEMLRDSRGTAPIEVQPLLEPETLHLDRRTAELIAEKLDELKAVGFDLERFGGDSFLVRTVPAAIRGRSAMQLLKDLAEELADGSAQGCLVPARDEIYILCSCKMAVKAGDKLGHAEMERLVHDLAQTENPYLCPHGRPITVVMPKSDLMRRFKR